MEKDYRKEGEEMEKKKRKYSRTDKVILGIGFTILGLFVLSIAIPIIYVVLASFICESGKEAFDNGGTDCKRNGQSSQICAADAYRTGFEG